MKPFILAFVFVTALTSGVCAQGHSHKGPNGGTLHDVVGGHAEFVDTPGELTIHLTDENGKSVSAKDATGKATVLAGGKTETIDMTPSGSKLSGALSKPLSPGDKVVVSAKTADGRKIQLRHVER